MTPLLEQLYPDAVAMSTLQHNVCDKVRTDYTQFDSTQQYYFSTVKGVIRSPFSSDRTETK